MSVRKKIEMELGVLRQEYSMRSWTEIGDMLRGKIEILEWVLSLAARPTKPRSGKGAKAGK